jgi:hypothetical protein
MLRSIFVMVCSMIFPADYQAEVLTPAAYFLLNARFSTVSSAAFASA